MELDLQQQFQLRIITDAAAMASREKLEEMIVELAKQNYTLKNMLLKEMRKGL